MGASRAAASVEVNVSGGTAGSSCQSESNRVRAVTTGSSRSEIASSRRGSCFGSIPRCMNMPWSVCDHVVAASGRPPSIARWYRCSGHPSDVLRVGDDRVVEREIRLRARGRPALTLRRWSARHRRSDVFSRRVGHHFRRRARSGSRTISRHDHRSVWSRELNRT